MEMVELWISAWHHDLVAVPPMGALCGEDVS